MGEFWTLIQESESVKSAFVGAVIGSVLTMFVNGLIVPVLAKLVKGEWYKELRERAWEAWKDQAKRYVRSHERPWTSEIHTELRKDWRTWRKPSDEHVTYDVLHQLKQEGFVFEAELYEDDFIELEETGDKKPSAVEKRWIYYTETTFREMREDLYENRFRKGLLEKLEKMRIEISQLKRNRIL